MSPAIDTPPPGGLTPGRRALLLTILIFLAPVLVGGSLYIFGWRPTKMANHGELIQPPKALAFEELAGEVRTRTAGKWLLLIAGDGPCETACTELAEQSRAIQVSLNRDMGRLARIVLTAAPTPALRDLQTRQPDLMVVAPPASWHPALQAGSRHRFYVVDPAGNLMMQYAPEAEAKGVRADLERLLKHSWIG